VNTVLATRRDERPKLRRPLYIAKFRYVQQRWTPADISARAAISAAASCALAGNAAEGARPDARSPGRAFLVSVGDLLE
jgi:hypothetical protein